MALHSKLFKDDKRLQQCLVQNSSHVTPGAVGDHVHRIQMALALLDDLHIVSSEITAKMYGPSTAAAVLAFKQRRKIINFSYQTQADNIVGEMTIAALDKEMVRLEGTTFVRDIECQFVRDPNSQT